MVDRPVRAWKFGDGRVRNGGDQGVGGFPGAGRRRCRCRCLAARVQVMPAWKASFPEKDGRIRRFLYDRKGHWINE